MAPSVMLYITNLAKAINSIYIMAHITSASPAVMPQSRGALGTSTPRTAPGTFIRDGGAWRNDIMVAKQFHGMYDYIPNTLSTTAHIHTLLFQPGSGAWL